MHNIAPLLHQPIVRLQRITLRKAITLLQGTPAEPTGDLPVKPTTLRPPTPRALVRRGVHPSEVAQVEVELGEFREDVDPAQRSGQVGEDGIGEVRPIAVRSDGNVLWEHGVKGEDGGMVWMVSSYEKSMNVALTRLLTEAMEEFTSELFYQSVKKENSKIP